VFDHSASAYGDDGSSVYSTNDVAAAAMRVRVVEVEPPPPLVRIEVVVDRPTAAAVPA